MTKQFQTRRDFLKAAGLGAAAIALNGCTESAKNPGAAGAENPNIIFIMADDLGFGDITCYNPDSKIHTPNIDRLAAQGISFTDAHSPSSVCTPTRYGVLTGRYCWRSPLKRGVYGGFNRPLIEKDRMTVASLLKKHGYGTACIGKWHLGMDWTLKPGADRQDDDTIDFSKPIKSGPGDLGFDRFFGTSACTTDDPPFCFIDADRTVGTLNVVSGQDPASEGRDLLMVPGWRHEDADTRFTAEAIDFIEKHVKKRPDDPFFLYFPASVPHIPWLPPGFVKGKSQAGPRGDQVVLMDWMVGQIVKTLDKLDIADNTLLIFTSDNGPRQGVNGHESSGPLRGHKGEIWEGGHRVPFIARWPGKIKPGSKSGQVTCLTDLMATCAAIIGTSLPENAGQDSYDMLPALLDENLDAPVRKTIVHHSGTGVFAIRKGSWKLIVESKGSGYHDGPPRSGSPGQLYNLADDPYEKNDLLEERPRIVKRLTNLLKKYKKQGHSRPEA
ncbi:MAG: sulfatase family protein [Planctomycetota bacterium]|jgi:arylsulfatase A-like enzyme